MLTKVWALLLLIVTIALAGCSSSSAGGEKGQFTDSPYANVDLANTRNATSSIKAATASSLQQAWSLPLEAQGERARFSGSPVVVDGVAYLQDPDSNVLAIDANSGEILWEKRFEAPTGGPNAVIAVQGKIFGATPSSAFALDADTGKELWSVPLVHTELEHIAMAPGYHDGLVYLATSPNAEQGGEVGTLWALDAKSGKKVWHFDTVPRSLWGHPEINFGGGLSGPPAFDGKGSMYIGTSSPGPIPGSEEFPWGSSRPGPNLYSNSVVKLNEKTGKVEWFYQVTPHSICRWDVGAPVLSKVDGRHIVVAASQGGILVALDRETGKPLWRKPVGKHDGHDDDGLLAAKHHYASLHMPVVVYPGVFGGVSGPIAIRGRTVFVPVVDWATRLNTQVSAEMVGVPTGQLVALNLATGAVRWKKRLSSGLFGPVVATNDLVISSTFDGRIYAFNAKNGDEVWSEELAPHAEGGVTVTGNTLLARAGLVDREEVPQLVAYRLGG
ncbi:MAG TPA: PQQ-binding-like beta-propeller repeat protein [Solirubrobacterales bacterium]|nr:PQQ-binding-like beta-propeller repeat protein [Solirubrobacterales bacterium]